MTNTQTPAPYTVAFAQVTDRWLADLHGAYDSAKFRRSQDADHMHSLAGDRRDYRHGTYVWRMTLDDVLAATIEPWNQDGFTKARASFDALTARLAFLWGAIGELDDVYNRPENRWPRFFLVVSSVGHIHSHMGCSSCHMTTRFAWLPDLSGLDEAAAVAAHGAKLCTVCFPSAPVEFTNYFDAKAAAAKASRCSGSGKTPTRENWNRCPDCGKYGRPTKYGATKAHQRDKD